MKSWLAKFKISAALDGGQPLTPSLRHRLQKSADLRAFADHVDALDRALKQNAPAAEPPAFLHASIMRAVELSGRPTSHRPFALRWLPAAAFAIAILLAAAWWGTRQPAPAPAPQPAFAAASTTPGLGEQMTRTVSTTLVSPLSDEWQRLDLDLNKAMDFLAASLP